MKTLKYIFVAAALGLTATSCYDLDLEPKGLVYENVLFQSDNGIKKYLASAYHDLPIEDFNYVRMETRKVMLLQAKVEISGRLRNLVQHPVLLRRQVVQLLMAALTIGLMIVSVNLTICWKNCLSIKAILRKMFIILI